MSAPAFTPGPWSVGAGGFINSDEDAYPVARVERSREVAATANARLIAAAPDLYAALRDLLDNENSYAPPYEGADGQWICECGRFEASDEPQSCGHTRARAALAKAVAP